MTTPESRTGTLGRLRDLTLGAAVGALTVGAVAYAAIPDAGGVIHACREKVTGVVRVVETESSCLPVEVAIAWNQAGPAGSQGPVGERGARGEKGDEGEPCPQGVPGPVAIQAGGGAIPGGQAAVDVFLPQAFPNAHYRIVLTPTGNNTGWGEHECSYLDVFYRDAQRFHVVLRKCLSGSLALVRDSAALTFDWMALPST